MTVTKESGGRLNAFAQEPKIELITSKPSSELGSRVFQIIGFLLFVGLLSFSLTLK